MKVSHCDTRWNRTSIVSKVAAQLVRFITTLNTISLFQLNKSRLRLQTLQNVSARTLKTKVLSSLTFHPTRIPNINELHPLTQFAHHTPSSFCYLDYQSTFSFLLFSFCWMVSKLYFQILLLKFLAVIVVALLNLFNSLCTKFYTYATKLSFSGNTMLFSYLNYISIAYFHCSYRYRYSITSY